MTECIPGEFDELPSGVETQFEKQIHDILAGTSHTDWPTFTGAEQTAFETLQADLQSQFGVKLWTDLSKMNQSQIDAIKNGANPPDPAAWNAVLAKVEGALADMTTIQTFFQGQKVYLLGGQTVIYEVAQQTMGYVGLEDTDPPPPNPFPLGALLEILLAPASLESSGIGSAAAGIILGAVGFINSDSSVSQNQKLNQFVLASLQFESQLTTRFNDFFDAANQALVTASRDYGKLTSLAKLLNDPQVTWPTEKSPVSALGMKELEISMWKFFLPARWPIANIMKLEVKGTVEGATEAVAQAQLDGNMTTWPQSFWALTGSSRIEPYTRARLWDTSVSSLAEAGAGGHQCNPRLANGSALRLFSTLGVSRADVFSQQNGWSGFKTVTVQWPYSRSASWVLGD